ncbi:alpha/beta fold hydrolase [Microterricola pindariensis]|uniref:Proline iminopeptidase n=1 Tax=Microterricola pindariensis TaxID=478010 RepID=A0ABX5AWB0_9MICO|nr:alpha/beta fold hydrolase [Microterricola pindariensis]PPL19177.1 proline iminopeptidase [Microterricola pindariensis]
MSTAAHATAAATAAEYTIADGILVRDHRITVPVDWGNPESGESIEFFARELVDGARRHEKLPLLVYLQGGPGGKSPRPTGREGFLRAALGRFRVILPDQRGTGRSSAVTAHTMERFPGGEEGADYLRHFRADSIVRDLEALRAQVFGGERWWTLGQSYGGFLTLHYLSTAPEAIIASAVAGGLPSIEPSADEVYRRTYPRVLEKNERFYARFPGDRERVARVADAVAAGGVLLPDGDTLTVPRLQSLGLDLGMKPGADRLHWIFDEAWSDTAETRLSETFLSAVRARTAFDTNPLFAVLQESIYGGEPARWAAQRALAAHPQLDPSARPLHFTGEMMYPWMFEQIRALRPFQAAVERLMAREDPIELYALPRLAANEVPVEAVVYHDDMYVDAGLSLQTAGRVGALNAWVTNEFEHDGLHGDDVAERLFGRLAGRVG